MATSVAPQLKQRSAFEIIDVSIQVLRRHYATFVMLFALGAIPSWIVLWLSGFMTFMTSFNPNVGALPTDALNLSAAAWAPLTWAWARIFTGAIVVAASDAYLTGDLDPGRAIRAAWSRALPNIFVGFLLGIAMFFGAFVFLVGAIYVYLRYFAAVPALMLENTSVFDAFHRSRDLSQGFKWRILGTVFLSWVILWVVVLTLQAVLALVPMVPIARILMNAVVQLFVAPLLPIVLTVLYYDQRIRKDGFDLEVMARGIAPLPAQG
ncbi:MAG TPA: hypothetical protein VIC24_14630 [Gemmatimonadaceae bacterium]|jgi:hypothetical protein